MTLADRWNSIFDYIIEGCKTFPELKDLEKQNSYNVTNGVLSTGLLRAVQIIDLQPGQFIDSFDISINTPLGSVRGKLFEDSNNEPGRLLGESDSKITTAGIFNIKFRKMIEVPQDGTIWIVIENDNAGLDIDLNSGEPAGTLSTCVHVYGDGPEEFTPLGGTEPFWTSVHYNSKVAKFFDVRGAELENFYAIVSADGMKVEEITNRGSVNKFVFKIDISYGGVDFQESSSKMLYLCSQIYDKFHLTTLGGKVLHATVNIDIADVNEADRLYLIAASVSVTCSALVIQI